MVVSEKIILEVVRSPTPERLMGFDLSYLLNDPFTARRRIDLQAGQTEHVSPGRYLQVMDMASGRALAWWEEGMHDYSIFHSYLIGEDGRSARYTKDLFNPDHQCS